MSLQTFNVGMSLTVALSINATVVGSKNAADDETGEAKASEGQEDPVEEDKEEEAE